MNCVEKERLVRSLCKLAAKLCSYSKQPCDCKFISDDADIKTIATGSESGSGCPEIASVAQLIAHMTDQEFYSLAERAGLSIFSKDQFEQPINVFQLINSFQEDRFKQERISYVKTNIDTEFQKEFINNIKKNVAKKSGRKKTIK